jgi:hypothetical protein
MNMIEDKKIKIRQPFREQYTLTIDSEVNAVDSFITSVVEIRYDFQVMEIKDDSLEVKLLLLDNKIVKANNPMIKEVAQVSQVLGRMYSELHLQMNHNGKIIKVLNTDLILSKWKDTKAEMQKHISGNKDLENVISLHDALFESPEKVKLAAQANEFFPAFFGHIYDADLPFTKKIVGTNIFNTANLEWNIVCEPTVPLPAKEVQTVVVSTKASPQLPLSDGFCNAAYHQFADKIKINAMNIRMSQEELRHIDYETGRVKKSSVTKTEVVYPEKLYHKISFSLMSDAEKKLQKEKQQEQRQKTTLVEEPIEEKSKPEIYKVVDGKEFTFEEWKLYEERQWQIYQEKKKNKKGLFGF